MNVVIWHTHGSWTTNFVQGNHHYLVPVVNGRGPDGRGRAETFDWPGSVTELTPNELADAAIDVVIVQSVRELGLAKAWLGGRVPGRDVPVIWLEHNAPQGRVNEMCHPARDRDDVTVVHVTPTNALFWDTGDTPTRVIEHGVIDPGYRWTGEIESIAVVVNEPVRRGRVAGTDLLPIWATAGNVDVFGMGTEELSDHLGHPSWLRCADVTQAHLHDELALRRCYLHPFRWTSLGLSLIEAMMLGMPVVALATTEVPIAVGACSGIVSNDLPTLVDGLTRLLADAEYASELGRRARTRAIERFSLERFLAEWDELLEVTCR